MLTKEEMVTSFVTEKVAREGCGLYGDALIWVKQFAAHVEGMLEQELRQEMIADTFIRMSCLTPSEANSFFEYHTFPEDNHGFMFPMEAQRLLEDLASCVYLGARPGRSLDCSDFITWEVEGCENLEKFQS